MAAELVRMGVGLEDYRMRLRGIGTPTIFEIDIPIEQIPEAQLESMAKTMLAMWGNKFLKIDPGYDYDMGFVVRSDIDSSCIASHFYPKKIRDQHSSSCIFSSSKITCSECE